MENATNTPAQKGATITKTVSVHAVTANGQTVNYPSNARAVAAQQTLALFGVDATIETVKKTIAI